MRWMLPVLWAMTASPASAAIAAVHEIGIPATAISARPPTLDDVYLRLTGGRLDGHES